MLRLMYFLVSCLQGKTWICAEKDLATWIGGGYNGYAIHWFFWLLTYFLLDMSSTTAWMESVIKKKQKKRGNTSQAAHENPDIFEELNRYLNKDRLRREECPNPIAYWGVSGVCCIILILLTLICSFSIDLRILSSVWWHAIILQYQQPAVLLSDLFPFLDALTTHDEDKWRKQNLVDSKKFELDI